MTITQGLIAVILYLLIILAAMQSHLLLGLLATGLFTFRYGAVALLPLAVLLDGYYGAFFTVPLFSIAAIVWYVLSEVLRVRMNIVQSEYE